MPHEHSAADMQQCIQDCLDCHEACLETVRHCLTQGGRHAEVGHVTMLLDCAQICAASADFMLRGSHHHADTCGLCATICDACADDCSTFADDAFMAACADECRRCAISCRDMAG